MALVLFDIGGVLVQIRHTWNDIFRAMGEAEPSTEMRQADYQPLTDYQDASLTEADYLVRLSADFGIDGPTALRAHQSMLVADYPGALELILDLRAAGHVTACLSNTNELHWRRLTDPIQHPAIAALDHRFASFELGVNKPEPAAFEIVRRAIPTDVAWFFDDLPSNVASAVRLGWNGATVDPAADPVGKMRAVLVGKGLLPT